MTMNFSATIRKDEKWWIGWVQEIPGVSFQGRTRTELLANLKSALQEAIDFNRAEARDAAREAFEEVTVTMSLLHSQTYPQLRQQYSVL